MGLVDRVKNILLTPQTEWDVIAAETTPPKDLVIRYVLPLAGAAAVAAFIKESIIGSDVPFLGTVRISIEWGLVGAITHLIMSVVGVFLIGFIIDALAPKFGAQKNMDQATKVAIYACTAVWVGGVLRIVPWIGPVFVLIGALYSLYLLYLGLPRLMKSPEDKSLAYTGTVIGCIIVIGIAVGIISWMVGGPSARMSLGGAPASAQVNSVIP